MRPFYLVHIKGKYLKFLTDHKGNIQIEDGHTETFDQIALATKDGKTYIGISSFHDKTYGEGCGIRSGQVYEIIPVETTTDDSICNLYWSDKPSHQCNHDLKPSYLRHLNEHQV